MLYSFELVILGVILLGTMSVCGLVLWHRRRREAAELGGDGYRRDGASKQ